MSTFDPISFIDPNVVIEVQESTQPRLIGRRVTIADFCRARRAAFWAEQETGRLLVRCGTDFISGMEVAS